MGKINRKLLIAGGVILFLSEVLSIIQDYDNMMINNQDKEEGVVQINYYTTNATTSHEYPWVASFLTFICVLVALVMVITFAPLLGR